MAIFHGMIGMSYNADTNFFSDLKSFIEYLATFFSPGQKINICFIPTASRDNLAQRIFFHAYLWWKFPQFQVTTLLTSQICNHNNHDDLKILLSNQDIIYVGGGSTPYLVQTWKNANFDELLKSIFETRSIILSGVSAGLECWFQTGLTDNGQENGPLINTEGLGWIEGYCTPHYQIKQRKDAFDESIKQLGLGYACEDGTAILFAYKNGQFKYDTAIRTRDDAEAFEVKYENEICQTTYLTHKI